MGASRDSRDLKTWEMRHGMQSRCARSLGSLRAGSMPISGRACQVGELIEFLVLGGDIDERKEGTPSGSGAGCRARH